MSSTLIYALHRSGLIGLVDQGRDIWALSSRNRRTSFSQHGEDLFLLEYFGSRKGVYIDIGANHPLRLSNTYLLYRSGWTGLIVEPIRRLYAKHKRFRPKDIQVNAAVGDDGGTLTFYEMVPSVPSTCDAQEAEDVAASGTARLLHQYSVPIVSIAELYKTYLAGQKVQVLSVDAEGHDMSVLRSADWEAMSPELVICEFINEETGSELSDFLAQQGYKPLRRISCNMIFARS